MTHRIRIAARARADADEVYSWICDQQRDPLAAERWYWGLKAAILSLQYGPRRCPVAPESTARHEVRQLLYQRYRILFALDEDCVHVLLVRHASRLPPAEAEVDRALQDERTGEEGPPKKPRPA